jgi:hypothetical protein
MASRLSLGEDDFALADDFSFARGKAINSLKQNISLLAVFFGYFVHIGSNFIF